MVKSVINKLWLYWHTAKYLKFVQWRYRIKNAVQSQVRRRFPEYVRRRLLRRVPGKISCRTDSEPVAWFKKRHDGEHGMFRAEDILNGRFTFLHRSKQFDGPVSWRNPEFTYLWDFNLHYFEYLCALTPLLDCSSSAERDKATETITRLLDSWINCNLCPERPAWHPYPTSLRVINWIKLFINHPFFANTRVLKSLYLQLLFLERNIEKHLLANHVLENGRSLVFGGLFFQGRDAERWLITGLKILRQEVKEEVLPKGGHFERSPMYHCIILEGLLDTYAYLTAMQRDATWLMPPIQKMCAWLDDVKCPDGSFPLFNDAAFGISAMPEEIQINAGRMIGYKRKSDFPKVRECDKFFILDASPFFCVIDGAPIGPSYNPGHAHSDNLSYELFLYGRRFVVDTGTYGYEADVSRQFFRSSCNHNTVVVNGLEQSQTWGGFRVAKRSNPYLSRAGRNGEYLVFQGAYRNQVVPSQGIVHERILVVKPSSWILVWDMVQAKGDIKVESRCHFAPGWCISEEGGHFVIAHTTQGLAYCYPIQVSCSAKGKGKHAPEFGKTILIEKLTFTAEGRQRLEMGYVFTHKKDTNAIDFHVNRLGERLIVHTCDGKAEIDLKELGP